MSVLTLRQIPTAIQSFSNFEGNSMRGRQYGTGNAIGVDPGRLAGIERDRFLRDRPQISYLVWSYVTPIGWETAEGVYIVTQKFSVTTSRHQACVRQAWA